MDTTRQLVIIFGLKHLWDLSNVHVKFYDRNTQWAEPNVKEIPNFQKSSSLLAGNLGVQAPGQS